MSDYQRRIEERQAVSDAYDRGEVTLDEMQAQLDGLPLLPAPRSEGDDSPVTVVVARRANSWLERLGRWLRRRTQ